MSNIILPGGEGKANVASSNSSGISRRQFLIGSGALAGAAALFGVTSFTPNTWAGVQLASAAGLNSDLDILQFALTLEHLEDAAYRAANASGLLSGQISDWFKTFGDHEHQHVAAITDVISKMGAQPVQEQAHYNLPSFASAGDVVAFFAVVEEVGAGAYLGAAPLIMDKNILAAAAAIHNVEAQHASSLKAYMNDPMPSPAFGTPLSYDDVIKAVTPLLTGAMPPPSGTPPGMPTTGVRSNDIGGPLALVAGISAIAAGALLHVRTRNISANGEKVEVKEEV